VYYCAASYFLRMPPPEPVKNPTQRGAAKPPLPVHPNLYVHALDMDAQGVARSADGKVVFIDGALPTEWVSARTWRQKNQWEAAHLGRIHRECAQRVRPACPHFGLHAGACGGCKMQHLHGAAQVAIKQRVLEDNLRHLAKVQPALVLPPVYGPHWGYRFRARLAVRYVHKKGKALVGFHERKSRYIADIHTCKVLPPHVAALLPALQALVAALDARERCPQIELACGDAATALVLRHLQPLSRADLAHLADFAARHSSAAQPLQWWLQAGGPDTARPMQPGAPQLAYDLPEFGLRMAFAPTDFTQVNPHINRVLVARALHLLDVNRGERVIDWFCGLGNFTLALATRAGAVLGVEGSSALVQRAQANYAANAGARGVHAALAPVSFVARNLFEMDAQRLQADGSADKWLLDPPREGALALCKALADVHQRRLAGGQDDGWTFPRRIVYVSCNPATLARDAGLLVHQGGYDCSAAGVVNMFAHTAHVESVAVFERRG